MAFENFLDPVFSPLLRIDPIFSIGVVSLIASVIVIIAYKLMTDQNLMKQLKDELKQYQKQAKELREHPDKVLEVNKKMMDVNMKYMLHSLKPTILTFIPIIIIFGWLNGHMAFMPITPGSEFTTTIMFDKIDDGNIELIAPDEIEVISDKAQKIAANKASWALKGPEGLYVLEYRFNSQSYTREVLVTEEKDYITPKLLFNDGTVKEIDIDNEPIRPLNLFGWRIGWLGTYIIFSIVFSILLRKIFKVY